MYAQIITGIAHQEFDRVFTYIVPEEMRQKLCIGMRVLVPFGKFKDIEGYVLGFTDHTDLEAEKLKSVIRILDDFPALNEEQLQLIAWMQKQYHAMAVHVIRLFLPAEMRGGRVSKKFKTVVASYLDTNAMDKALSSLKYNSKAYQILNYLSDSQTAEKSLLQQVFGAIDQPLKALVQKNYITVSKEEIKREPYKEMQSDASPWHELKQEQEGALCEIIESLENTRKNIFLYGVTGSGKTEVYMRAIQEVIRKGGSAIMLVPEISLTPQMVQRFRQRFGNGVAVLHSSLSAGERYDEWRRIRLGEARVVVGARSAVFAPCKNLKLIIIDEAHESSYLSEVYPAYDTVEVANKRMELCGGITVLGSATPSVEHYYEAANGKYQLIRLNERINGRPLPEIEVVNMAQELASGNKSIFSKKLFQLLEQTLKDGNQAMLFLNRRGHSTIVTCRACGAVIKCKNCEISMTYHSSGINSRTQKSNLRCHYCGYEEPYPDKCPECGSAYIKHMGAGTEKVEEEFSKLFPNVKVLRMDNDTTRTKDAHLHILTQFAAKEAQVLIGTQMIAKGLDFPGVALVGVVSADTMLQLPDYKSRERTFSLITQVAGRAGRAEASGTVVLQTYTPKHYAITDAVHYSYEDFYKREICQRAAMWYPPFGFYIRLLFSSEKEADAQNASKILYETLRQEFRKNPGWNETILSYYVMPAPILRIKNLYRYQIILKLKRNNLSDTIENTVYEKYQELDLKNIYVNIEVNPSNIF